MTQVPDQYFSYVEIRAPGLTGLLLVHFVTCLSLRAETVVVWGKRDEIT